MGILLLRCLHAGDIWWTAFYAKQTQVSALFITLSNCFTISPKKYCLFFSGVAHLYHFSCIDDSSINLLQIVDTYSLFCILKICGNQLRFESFYGFMTLTELTNIRTFSFGVQTNRREQHIIRQELRLLCIIFFSLKNLHAYETSVHTNANAMRQFNIWFINQCERYHYYYYRRIDTNEQMYGQSK